MKHLIFTSILIITFCVFSFAQIKTSSCPIVKIVAPESVVNLGDPILFSVQLNEKLNNLKIEPEWKVLSGDIIQGQGTSQIKVKPEIGAEKVTADVKIKGFPENCENYASKFVNIIPAIIDIFPIYEYGKLSRNEERARLDVFLTSLLADENFQGIIHIRTNKNESNKVIKTYIQFMIKHFKFRKFPKERIIFAVEKSNERKTMLWNMPKDFKFQICEDCEILKGADL